MGRWTTRTKKQGSLSVIQEKRRRQFEALNRITHPEAIEQAQHLAQWLRGSPVRVLTPDTVRSLVGLLTRIRIAQDDAELVESSAMPQEYTSPT